jgi:AraC family transcriptional regulator, transcriptional activator of pobA
MDHLKRFETVRDYNVFNNNETLHPLISVIDFSKAAPRQGYRMYSAFTRYS